MPCRSASIRPWTIFTRSRPDPTARRCARSPTPAAAICSSTRSISLICATRRCASTSRRAATTRTRCPTIYAGMINAAMADIPADMTITMHLCRGNFRSTFVASGGYEPVAEILFNSDQGARLFHGIRQRARRRLRAAAVRAEGQDDRARARHQQSPARSKAATKSSAGSTKRRNTSRSTSSACRRNAASPRPRTEMFCPRRSNGRSCA